MTIQVEVSPEVQSLLIAEAGRRGLPVEEYAGKLLISALTPYATGNGILTVGDVEEMSRKLADGSENLPILTLEANERSSYYEDRW